MCFSREIGTRSEERRESSEDVCVGGGEGEGEVDYGVAS